MALPTQSVRDKRYALGKQTTWGTATAGSGTFIELDVEPNAMELAVQQRDQQGAHATRLRTYNDLQIDTNGVIPKITLPGDAKYNDFDSIVYGFTQEISTSGTDPYIHTLTWHASQPDFHDDAGYFATILEVNSAGANSWRMHNAVSSELTMTFAPGGRLKYNSVWEANAAGATNIDASSGTFNRAALEYWYTEKIATFTYGANNLTCVGECEIKLVQNLIPVGHDGSGNYETFHIGDKQGTFKMVVLRNSASENIVTDWQAGTAASWEIGWGTATPAADGDLQIVFTGKVTDVKATNEEVLGYEVTGEILAATAASDSITITIVNNNATPA